ncbi:MAG: hypothetical protein J2P46_09075 [Zavarzinella sp.]|nr:hypothetical protein [Zavarzinella sp.]
MAFNPFEAFSIRSRLGRSVMAILGIVVMLTFVLSTGAVGTRNDFFDQLLSAFSSRGKGEVLATGYGDDIHDTELAEIARQRKAANQFLVTAIDSAYTEWARELERDLNAGRLSADTKGAISPYITLRANPNSDPRALGAFLMNRQNTQRIAIAQILAKPDSDDKKALEATTAILAHDLARSPTPPVLPDIGFERERDLIDFALLLKKADRLGIKYSEEAVRELVQRDTGGRLRKDDNAAIERALRQSHQFEGMTGDWLITAIGNEYRAAAALAAFQGQSPLLLEERAQRNNFLNQLLGFPVSGQALGETQIASAPPGAVTPHEFFEFYKDRCSEHTFSVLELRADAYLDQVKEEPTPKERVELFNKYRGELPDPAKPTPGFKEPRKVKVEYVTLDATAPRVTQAIPKVQAASTFLAALPAPMTNGVSAILQAAHPGLAETLPIRAAVSQKMEENLAPTHPLDLWAFQPRDTSVYRPQPIISALGVLAGGPDVTTFFAAAAAVHQNVEVIDHRAKARYLQGVLAPFNPTLGNMIGTPAFVYALNPKLPPEGLYLGAVTEDLKKRQRQKLFEADVQQLETKLFDLTKDASPFAPRPDKAKMAKAQEEAKKYLTEWLKDRGLTPAGSKEPRDQFALVTDPDLKPLNEKALPEPDGTNSLSKKLFESFDTRQFGGSGMQFRVQPHMPEWFPAEPVGNDFDKPNYFVWVSQEVAANTYPNLDTANKLTNGEMTKRVDRAWKLEKARALAKADADRLAEQVKAIGKSAATDAGGVEKQLRDLAEQKKARKFELDRLALLKFQHEATQARMGYERPKIDKSLVLYPTDNFADRLLELRKEPVGGVVVLPDAPRSRFYVACETQRTEKTLDQFRDVFAKATATGPAQNPLYGQYALPDERRQAMDDVLARMRSEARLQEKDALKNRERRETE